MSGLIFVTIEDISRLSGSGIATRELIAGYGASTPDPLYVICPKPKNNIPKRIQDQVDSFFFLPPETGAGNPLWHLRIELSVFKQLLKIRYQKDPSVIITRLSPSTLFPVPAAKVFGIPHILLIRGMVNRRDEYDSTKFSSPVEQLVRFNVRVSDRVFVAYSELKDWVDQYRRPNQYEVEVLPNAVDPTLFSPTNDVKQLEPNRIPPDKFIIGFTGSLSPRHKVDVLIDAVAKSDEAHALIIGDGPERESLENQAQRLGVSDRVTFVGEVNHRQVPGYLSLCDVGYGVVAPEQTSNPIKVYEYLACEIPVITSHKAEFAFVEQTEAGITIEDVSAASVADAIAALQRIPEEDRMNMGHRGRKYVVENHTWNGIAAHTLRSLQDPDEG